MLRAFLSNSIGYWLVFGGLGLSRAVFARYLRTNPRTLENWEQGRAKPNAQAALLIRLVEKYPDTVQRLAPV